MKIRIFVFLLLFCFVKDSPADYITLNSGRVVEGKISYQTSILIRILTDDKIRMQEFLVENVKSITKGNSPPPSAKKNTSPRLEKTTRKDKSQPVQIIPPIKDNTTAAVSVVDEPKNQLNQVVSEVNNGARGITNDTSINTRGTTEVQIEDKPKGVSSKNNLAKQSLWVNKESNSKDESQFVVIAAPTQKKPLKEIRKTTIEAYVSDSDSVQPVRLKDRETRVQRPSVASVKGSDSDKETVASSAQKKLQKIISKTKTKKKTRRVDDDPIESDASENFGGEVELYRIQDLAKIVPYSVSITGILFILAMVFLLNWHVKNKMAKMKKGAPKAPQAPKNLQSAVNQLSSEFESNQLCEENLGFWSLIPRIIVYPFRKDSIVCFSLIVLTFYSMNLIMSVPYLTMPFIILFFYTTTILVFQMIQTAGLSHNMTDFQWPNFLRIVKCMSKVFFLVLLIVFYFGPATFYFLKYSQWNGRIFFVLMTPGLFLLPMGLLAIAIVGGMKFLNPIFMVKAIFSAFISYSFTALLVITLLGFNVFLCFTDLAFIPLWGKPVKWLIFGYSLFLTMRLLGIFYRKYKSQLNWFSAKRKSEVTYENDYGAV